MRALIVGALLLAASSAWAGGPEMLLAVKTCTPPSPLHGSITYSTAGTYSWPTTDMGTCAIPLIVTVSGAGGGGGDWWTENDGTPGGTTSAVKGATWSFTATGGAGGGAYATGKAANGSGSASGSVTSVTTSTVASSGGASGDYYDGSVTHEAQDGGDGGYVQGMVTGNYTPTNQISVTVGAGGYATTPATAGLTGSVKIEW